MFAHLDGYNTAVAYAGFTSIVRSTFLNNTIHPNEYGGSVIKSDAANGRGGAGAMRLESCTLQGNILDYNTTAPTLPLLLTDNRDGGVNDAVIYSDAGSAAGAQVCRATADADYL